MADDRVNSTLRQIGKALDLPASSFIGEAVDPQSNHRLRALFEESELLRLFSAIHDPNARQAVLDYVREMAAPRDTAASG